MTQLVTATFEDGRTLRIRGGHGPCARCGRDGQVVTFRPDPTRDAVPWCAECLMYALAITLTASLSPEDRAWVEARTPRNPPGGTP